MSDPSVDPTIDDIDASPPVPSAADVRAAVAVLIASLEAGSRAAPHVIPRAAAAAVGRRLASLPAVLEYVHRGGPLPPAGWCG